MKCCRMHLCCVLLLPALTQLARAHSNPDYVANPEQWCESHTATLQRGTEGSLIGPCSLAAEDRTAAEPASLQTTDLAASSRQLLSNTSGNWSKYDPPYTVCVAPWTPITTCTPDSPQEKFTGYGVELFRALAAQVGWDESAYRFSCIPGVTAAMPSLMDPTSDCTVTTLGFLDPSLLTFGLVKYSWPIYKTQLRIMIHSPYQQGSMFAFLQAFNVYVWVLIPVTAVAVGLIIAVLEWASHLHKKQLRTVQDSERGWQTWLWYSLAKMVDIPPHTSDPTSNASRIVFAAWAFLMLVMISMFIAGSEGTVTEKHFDNPFPRGAADLAGHKVGTLSFWVSALQQYGAKPVPLAWNDDADRAAALAGLRAGDYDAIVLDEPSLVNIAATNSDCDLFIIGGSFSSFSVHLAFAGQIKDEVVNAFSQSIIMIETYYDALEQFEQAYIMLGGQINDCIHSSHGVHHQLGIKQVAGLWIVLGICIIAGIVISIINHIQKTWASGSSSRAERTKAMRSLSTTSVGNKTATMRAHVGSIMAVPQDMFSGLQSSLNSFTQHVGRHTGQHDVHGELESPGTWRAFLGFTSSSGESVAGN